jgi:protein SCO1
MRVVVHIALILLVGIGLGLAIRAAKPKPTVEEPEYFSNDDPSVDPSVVSEDAPALAPDGWMSEFELTERSGKTVTSDDLKGKPYVVSFFFTTCPSICVQQNQKVQELQSAFEGKDVRFVSISVDPETDDPEKLREYAARFKADPDQWLFMTGDLTYIRRVGAEVFRLAVDEKFHTEKFILVGADGAIVGYYSWPEKLQYQKLQADIRKLLDKNS